MESKLITSSEVFIIAEMSANHNQDFDEAVKIIEAAKAAGADAIKLQTYTPDTLTIDCDNEYFQIGSGTIWEGQILYDLYETASTPWEWQPELKRIANSIGLELFSSPFDSTAVDFLEEMDVDIYKIASFEIVDIPLIRRISQTGKPIIMSTGMSNLDEITEAVNTIRHENNNRLFLLKCTSSYPSLPEDMNLYTIPDLERQFDVPVGLSDHTRGIAVPIAAVALGATIIEKHFTLSRDSDSPDSEFSLEPHEFKAMVDAIRIAEKALGQVNYQSTQKEEASRVFRRSLFITEDMNEGDVFTVSNVRSIRPGYGLHTRYLYNVLGATATQDIERGTPVSWNLIE